ncbi:hypothetical protein ERO13_A13G196466v2 [Gossypium hirsutum]|nr:hypothetical protein ERO13_A13G196466v2 [Gossypium hirsutum]
MGNGDKTQNQQTVTQALQGTKTKVPSYVM